MPGYARIENQYHDWSMYNLDGKDYQILDPKELLLDIFKYVETPDEWDMKTGICIGPQSSGKTNFLRYVIQLLQNIPDYKNLLSIVSTNDLRILDDARYAYLFEGKKVICLIVDDAIRPGTDSRRSMSDISVVTTQQYCITRHILENRYGPNGIIFVLFSVQVWSALDKRIREPATFKLFTTFFDEDWFNKMFQPDQVEFMRTKTRDGIVRSRFKERRFAIIKTLAGDSAIIEVPFISKKKIQIPYMDRTIDKSDAIDKLSKDLQEKYPNPSEISKDVLKGFLSYKIKEYEKDYCVKITKTDLLTVIERASFNEYDNHDLEEVEETNLSVKDKIIKAFKIRNSLLSIEDIQSITKLGKRQIYNALLDDSTFGNAVKGKGIYYLVEQGFDPEEVKQYEKKLVKKLEF